MLKFWLISGAISGFLSVGLGAFGAHSLQTILNEYGKSIYEKAVLYQMFHTLALFLVGILYHLFKETSFFVAGWGFLLGIVLFSGSLYGLAITHMEWLGVITPFGGVAFLFGWFWLIWTLGKGTHLLGGHDIRIDDGIHNQDVYRKRLGVSERRKDEERRHVEIS